MINSGDRAGDGAMSGSQSVGVIAELWRFPVKSMTGERLDQADLTTGGLLGDRAYALIDVETGKVVSAKSVRLYSGILDCKASFVEPPKAGAPLPPVRIELPDGTHAFSLGGEADAALSALFGRAVRLAQTAPEDFTIDQHHPDIEGADPAGHRNETVQQKLGAAFFAAAGMPCPVAVGAFFDLFPMTAITTSTLGRLGELRQQGRIDARRFRMNIVVETAEPGFIENEWVGKQLSIGGESGLVVAMPDPRCVMTTLAQDDLEQDTDILRSLVQHNRLAVAGAGQFPCAGVYAVVSNAGTIRVGDEVGIG
jgi:uncharacterized protein YcbX